jgi:hypothetical protein
MFHGPRRYGSELMSLELLNDLVDKRILKGFKIDTGYSENNPEEEDELLLVLSDGTKLKVRASYSYSEGGRASLSVNDETLPNELHISRGYVD